MAGRARWVVPVGCLGFAILGAIAALWIAVARTPLPDFARTTLRPTLIEVFDRDGRRLARLRRADELCLPVSLADLDSELVLATLAAEDRRFHRHLGVDPVAIARAALQNLRAGRAVSGGSTLTQQLVKLLRKRNGPSKAGPRWLEKGIEAYWALVLEARLPKSALLEAYLNHAPYGPNIRGVEAAARIYFGHSADQLALEEAALLAALPQSPVRLDPVRYPARARAARDRVLARMSISSNQLAAAEARPLALSEWTFPAGPAGIAPHWSLRSRAVDERAASVRLPIDPALQRAATGALRAALHELSDRGADDGAIVVLDNASGEVRAWVGSPAFDDPVFGQFDAASALRQPGSALKPFAYALAFERGFRPASLLPDLPLAFPGEDGVFTPGNYNQTWRGPVRARAALANSWNTPAVALVEAIGVTNFVERLRALGLTSLQGSGSTYGLGAVLGVGEVTLCDLTNAYAALARGGVFRPRREILELRDAGGALLPEPEGAFRNERVLDRAAAFFVNAILADPRARAVAFGRDGLFDLPYPVAIKTGTSSDWRDNWAFGWDASFTVGVWIGRANGDPMDRVSGTAGAMLALRRVLDALHPSVDCESGLAAECASFPLPPPEVREIEICSLSGEKPNADCPGVIREWARRTDAEGSVCRWHQRLPLERRSGLLARLCTPALEIDRVLFTVPASPEGVAAPSGAHALESFALVRPGNFELWARQEGWPSPPHALAPCRCGLADCDRFASPLEDAHIAAGTSAQGSAIAGAAAPRLRILRPVSGSIYAIDESLPRSQQALALEASGGTGPVEWYVDGQLFRVAECGERVFWSLEPGRHHIRARSGLRGQAEEVAIEVEPQRAPPLTLSGAASPTGRR